MLLSIRRGATTLVFKIIIGLFIVALVILFSLGDYIGAFNRQDLDPVVYKVSGTAITEYRVSQQITQFGSQLSSVFPDGLDTPEKIKSAGLHTIVADQLLDPEISRQEHKRLGLIAGQQDVARYIAKDEQFRGSDGTFSNTMYEGRLSFLGMDNNMYRREVANRITAETIESALSFGPELVPAFITAPLIEENLQQRKFETLTLTRKFADEPEPTEEDLKAYQAENPDDFALGEMRTISALLINPADLEQDIEISEEQLAEAYEARKAGYYREETRTLRQVTFANEEEARLALAGMKPDATIEDLAEFAGSEIVKLPPGQSVPGTAHGDAGFKTERGKLSEPFESDFGWHVVSVDSVSPAYDPTPEQLRGTLTASLKSEAAAEMAEETSIEADKLVGEGAPLEEIAETLNLTVQKFAPVSDNGRTAFRSSPAGLPRDRKFLAELFRTPEGEVSALGTTEDGIHYVLRVDAVSPPRPQTFEEAEIRLSAIVKRKQWTDAMTAKGEELIATGKTLAEIGAEIGEEVQTSEFISRSTLSQAKTDARFFSGDLFEQPVTDKIIVLPAGSNVTLTRLVEIKEEDPAESEEAKQLVQNLANQYGNELRLQYRNALKDKANVSVSNAALDRAIETSARQLR